MGMTIVEKILSKHSDKRKISPGEVITARIDVAMIHDALGPRVFRILKEAGIDSVWSSEGTVAVIDHMCPATNVDFAESQKTFRETAREYGIKNLFDMNGICHQILPEKGYVCPGEILVGSDSHMTTHGALGAFATGVGASDMALTLAKGELWFKVPQTIKLEIGGELPKLTTSKDIILKIIGDLGVNGATYDAVEFCGKVIRDMSLDSRLTMTNMILETGAKAGIIEPDAKALDYVRGRTPRPFEIVKGDSDAQYKDIIELNVSGLDPQVAKPPNPGNVVPVSEAEGIEIDQAFIGSCTNGRYEDLYQAAQILRGKRIHPGVRMMIIPASHEIYVKAAKKGLTEIFLEAGALVFASSCGPCCGSYGVLAAREKCISSSNRNFIGRMGSNRAEIYLASPATVAASAINGKITDPRKLV